MTTSTEAPKRRGRPPGSKNKSKKKASKKQGAKRTAKKAGKKSSRAKAPKRRGRPPGVKNKTAPKKKAAKKSGKRRGRPANKNSIEHGLVQLTSGSSPALSDMPAGAGALRQGTGSNAVAPRFDDELYGKISEDADAQGTDISSILRYRLRGMYGLPIYGRTSALAEQGVQPPPYVPNGSGVFVPEDSNEDDDLEDEDSDDDESEEEGAYADEDE